MRKRHFHRTRKKYETTTTTQKYGRVVGFVCKQTSQSQITFKGYFVFIAVWLNKLRLSTLTSQFFIVYNLDLCVFYKLNVFPSFICLPLASLVFFFHFHFPGPHQCLGSCLHLCKCEGGNVFCILLTLSIKMRIIWTLCVCVCVYSYH